jgi:hypothetical protein
MGYGKEPMKMSAYKMNPTEEPLKALSAKQKGMINKMAEEAGDKAPFKMGGSMSKYKSGVPGLFMYKGKDKM